MNRNERIALYTTMGCILICITTPILLGHLNIKSITSFVIGAMVIYLLARALFEKLP